MISKNEKCTVIIHLSGIICMFFLRFPLTTLAQAVWNPLSNNDLASFVIATKCNQHYNSRSFLLFLAATKVHVSNFCTKVKLFLSHLWPTLHYQLKFTTLELYLLEIVLVGSEKSSSTHSQLL